MKDILSTFQQTTTPFYYYDQDLLRATLSKVQHESSKYGFHVHYAFKANANPRLLREMLAYNIGADCVSGGEVQHAIDIGFEPKKVVFAGVGKSDADIRTGLNNNIMGFNCESLPEIEIIDQLAGQMNKQANIAIRVNPNVDARTHHYITTGLQENKFGINPWEFPKLIELLAGLKNVKLTGLHFHIGSQITDMSVFRGLAIRVNEIKQWFAQRRIYFEHLNLGGGLGIDYNFPSEQPMPDFASYFQLFDELIELDQDQQIHFELGRSIIAQCGSFVSRVLYIKEGAHKKFAILDGGMNDMLRPALYQAYHKIENWTNKSGDEDRYDVVGPICESSDSFGKEVDLPITERGHFVALRSSGAYGEVMASTYNLRPLVQSVFSDDIS